MQMQLMTISQIEVAKELLNNSDATIQGILLSVIAILLVFIGMLWKSKINDQDYIREQDKANLEMLLKVTSTIDGLGKDVNKIDETTSANNTITSNILGIIKERLRSN